MEEELLELARLIVERKRPDLTVSEMLEIINDVIMNCSS